MDKTYQKRKLQSKFLALISVLSLVILFFVWNIWFDLQQIFPRPIEVFLLSVPIVISGIGMMRNKTPHFLLTGLFSLVYFMMGFWYLSNQEERIYGLIMIISSFLLFLSCCLYLKFQGKIEKSKSKPND